MRIYTLKVYISDAYLTGFDPEYDLEALKNEDLTADDLILTAIHGEDCKIEWTVEDADS